MSTVPKTTLGKGGNGCVPISTKVGQGSGTSDIVGTPMDWLETGTQTFIEEIN